MLFRSEGLKGPNPAEGLSAAILCGGLLLVGLFPAFLMQPISVGVAALMQSVLSAG